MSDMNVTIYDIAKNAMFPSLLYRVSSMATAGSAKKKRAVWYWIP